jgi:hypothetical protein
MRDYGKCSTKGIEAEIRENAEAKGKCVEKKDNLLIDFRLAGDRYQAPARKTAQWKKAPAQKVRQSGLRVKVRDKGMPTETHV